MDLLQQLPEVLEQIGRDVKAITVVLGRGRPDKPDTTGDKITGEEPKIKGNEPNGTIYESSDGGGVGAWKWQKRNGKWVVIDGDTGLVNAVTKNLKPGAYIKLRRQGNLVSCHMGGLSWGLFGYLGKTEKGYLPRQPGRVEVIGTSGIPLGFRSDDSCGFSLYDDDTNRAVAGIYVGGVGDSNFMRFTPYHADPKIKGNEAIPDIGPKNLRPPAMMWTTSDPWPDKV